MIKIRIVRLTSTGGVRSKNSTDANHGAIDSRANYNHSCYSLAFQHFEQTWSNRLCLNSLLDVNQLTSCFVSKVVSVFVQSIKQKWMKSRVAEKQRLCEGSRRHSWSTSRVRSSHWSIPWHEENPISSMDWHGFLHLFFLLPHFGAL